RDVAHTHVELFSRHCGPPFVLLEPQNMVLWAGVNGILEQLDKSLWLRVFHSICSDPESDEDEKRGHFNADGEICKSKCDNSSRRRSRKPDREGGRQGAQVMAEQNALPHGRASASLAAMPTASRESVALSATG